MMVTQKQAIRRQASRLFTTAWAVFTIGMALVLLIALVLNHVLEESARMLVERDVEAASQEVQDKLNMYTSLLKASSSFVDNVERPTFLQFDIGQFRNFINYLSVEGAYPGILGIGLAPVVKDNTKQYEEKMSDYLHRPYTIEPLSPPGLPQVPVMFLEPSGSPNDQVLGYNMYSEKTRREAIDEAINLGRLSISGPVILRQDVLKPKERGILLFAPIFLAGKEPENIAERKEKIVGFVYMPLRISDFVRALSIPRSSSSGLEVEIADVTSASEPASPLYESFNWQNCEGCTLPSSKTFDWAGRTWRVGFKAKNSLLKGNFSNLFIIFMGLQAFLVLAIYLLVLNQSNAQSRLRKIAAEKDRLLSSERIARGEAERAGRLKDEFLAVISHELRSPLNVILGWVQLLRKPKMAETQLEKGLENIERNSRLQARLIEDLLDISRYTIGKLTLEPKPTELRELISGAVSDLQSALEAKKITVRVHNDPAIKLVLVDPSRIHQVIWNLLSNAAKFCPDACVVWINTELTDEHIVISVADNGPGIDPSILPFIFDRFKQADSSITRKFGGLGLGLAISRSLIELHGGTINAYSDGLTKGAVFYIELPRKLLMEEDISEGVAKEASAAVPGAPDSLAGVKALVVDDEPDARQLCARVLEQSGATVVTAESGPIALEILERESFDIILSDLGMPEMDGFEFMTHVKSQSHKPIRDIPAIAVSALARERDVKRALDSGFLRHLAKPIEAPVLVETVYAICRGSGITQISK